MEGLTLVQFLVVYGVFHRSTSNHQRNHVFGSKQLWQAIMASTACYRVKRIGKNLANELGVDTDWSDFQVAEWFGVHVL
jgi:hypothetical protein